MTYPAAGRVEANASWLAAAVDLLRRENLPPAVVSNGGTPDLWRAADVAVATEHRPGTYIYLDRSQVARGVGSLAGGSPPNGGSPLGDGGSLNGGGARDSNSSRDSEVAREPGWPVSRAGAESI